MALIALSGSAFHLTAALLSLYIADGRPATFDCFDQRPTLPLAALDAMQQQADHRPTVAHFALDQLAFVRISPVSLAASRRIATNFEVGVELPSPTLSSGTSGFTSG